MKNYIKKLIKKYKLLKKYKVNRSDIELLIMLDKSGHQRLHDRCLDQMYYHSRCYNRLKKL